jgi:RNA polymerase sigma-54 factor
MTLTQRLELRQSQSLVMTPRLQQSLRMLRMSHLELADHVAAIVEANPLLETVAPPHPDWTAPRGRASGPDDAVDLAAAEVTLRDHLRLQIHSMRRDPRALAAADALIEELDNDGYLRVPLEEVAARHRLDDAAAAEGLALVQSCDPAGVGARDLKECLRLQLLDRDLLDERMAALVGGLDLLVSGRRAELAARCGVPLEALGKMLKALHRLDPHPGAGFTAQPVPTVVPDVFVRRAYMGWSVELNGATLPRVLVNSTFATVAGSRDGRLRAYVSGCRSEAAWLVRSLEQRARTVLAVAGAIVSHQERFLAIGTAGLRPLSRRVLAEKLGLHESTISRVTANKYLACDRGTFEMRFFFSQAIAAMQASENPVAAAAVQARIRTLIHAESASSPLSDDGIAAILRREGIDIARRTVAKYREGMGIPSSVARRRLKMPETRELTRSGN